jgi:hypothetical protein
MLRRQIVPRHRIILEFKLRPGASDEEVRAFSALAHQHGFELEANNNVELTFHSVGPDLDLDVEVLAKVQDYNRNWHLLPGEDDDAEEGSGDDN